MPAVIIVTYIVGAIIAFVGMTTYVELKSQKRGFLTYSDFSEKMDEVEFRCMFSVFWPIIAIGTIVIGSGAIVINVMDRLVRGSIRKLLDKKDK